MRPWARQANLKNVKYIKILKRVAPSIVLFVFDVLVSPCANK